METETHHQQVREYIDHLATKEELGIEEVDRHSPVEPAKPVANIPLTGVSVPPLDGITVVVEQATLGSWRKWKKDYK
jgi:hypothetical protein